MILRDPVHGLVAFETDEQAVLPALLEAAELQRLRRVRQLGLASLAYPGADHTRFSHAIGTAFVMTQFIERIRAVHEELPFWQRLTTERARDALAAALLHDLGHGPFSHLFEEAMPDGPTHEEWSRRIIRDSSTDVNRILCAYDPALPGRVAELVSGQHELAYLARAVSGSFDVDRCDYLLRDAHSTGVRYGWFDLDWLLRSLRFGTPESDQESPGLAIDGAKGLPAIESFILARLFMFQQVYFHKASRAADWMLTRLLERVRELLLDGSNLAGVPPAVASLARDGEATLGEYLALDDSVLWGAIATWCDAGDARVRDLASRLRARRLYKTYELYGPQLDRRDEILEAARAVAAANGLCPDSHVGLDAATDVPFDDAQESLTVVFPTGAPRKPGDVSFLLGRLRGERLHRVRLVFAPELRDGIVRALEA
jgi:HD superfamily phosphohydrolase